MEHKIGNCSDIGIVTVLFNPSVEDLSHIRRLAEIYSVIVVDNSPAPYKDEGGLGNAYYIPLYSNMGIANAQNVGIRKLLENTSIDYIVFLDQDSRVAIEYPMAIVNEYREINKSYSRLALLGPTVDNINTGEEYHSVIHRDVQQNKGFVPRRDVISSGSVIPRKVLEDVGLYESSLFIDFVDFDWCWRAERKGYTCGITKKVHISHQVGKREISFLSYKIIISAPIRYYYQYRNHLILCRREYVPIQWKIATGIKHLARLFYFPFAVKGGYACWVNMWKGIKASFRYTR